MCCLSNVAAACAAIRLATESLPERRPAATQISLTLLVGGSRSATVRKNSLSASVIVRQKALRRTLFHPSHEAPEYQEPNNPSSDMASTTVRTGGGSGCRATFFPSAASI